MEKYNFVFDSTTTIVVKGKGLKEALREYRQQNPKQLEATVEWLAKSGKEMKKLIRLREVNIGIDRYGNIVR